jgi:hypothetical protein
LACEKSQAIPAAQPVFRITEEEMYTIEIEEEDANLLVTLVCSCELPVAKVLEENFYCKHCDRDCGFPGCVICDGLDKMFEIRFRETK